MTSVVLATLAPVADAFEALGIRYRIGGSIASSALGVPRASIDVDVVAEMELRHVEPFVAALHDRFYVDAEMIRDAISRRDEFNVISLETMMKVDVFLPRARPFDRASFPRMVEAPLADDPGARSFPLATPEDVLLHELASHRMGGEVSSRQWEDALGLLAVRRGTLDEAWLDRWAADLGVADLLARARRETAA